MSGDSGQWAALDSQNERLVGAAQLQLCEDGQGRGGVPGGGRRQWRRRVAEAALGADGQPQPSRPSRHSRRRAARPQA
jgi:hypothetical protein